MLLWCAKNEKKAAFGFDLTCMQGCLIFNTEDYCFIPENSPMSVVQCTVAMYSKSDSRKIGRKSIRIQTM